LTEWKTWLEDLQKQSKTVAMIFNNNSGGHAAGNARQLMRLLDQPVLDIPKQLDLFNL
jgi:uncharacterized protein YecE (DUF72 family)